MTDGDWAFRDIKITIRADVYRDTFAVHTPIGSSGEWVITHVHTGFSLRSIIGAFDDYEKAIAAVEKIWPLHDNWQEVGPTMSQEAQAEISLKIIAAVLGVEKEGGE